MPEANPETGAEEVSAASIFFNSAQEPTEKEKEEGQPLDTEESTKAAETSEDETKTEEALYTVNPDGEEEEVTISELKSGYMKGKTFQRKTTEAATVAKESKAIKAEYSEKLDTLEKMLTEDVDWFESDEGKELKSYDPTEYWSKYEKTKDRVEKFKGMAKDRSSLKTELSEDDIKEECDLLLAKIPTWTDTKKMQDEGVLALAAAADAGFSDDEIARTTDHRFVVLSHKAAMYDKIMTAKPSKKEVKEKITTLTANNGVKTEDGKQTKTFAEMFYA